jgi:hypothetical protein
MSRRAGRLRQQVRFALTRREAMEFGGEAGKGLLGKFGVSRERELVERPLTLDKMTEHDKVRQLVVRSVLLA